MISVGNYWRDPHHLSDFYKRSIFLPRIDNEILTEDSYRFKNNFKRLHKLILIGGPDDGVISPWESRYYKYLFGLYLAFAMIELSNAKTQYFPL
jgi:palmitoyl-protein thioesterase